MNKVENLEAIKQMAYDLAAFYEKSYGCCSQCVVGAVKNVVAPQISDDVFLAATGLGAGIGSCGYACGALTGGIMVISCFVGRSMREFPNADKIRTDTFRIARRLVKKFEQEYGECGGDCAAIQTKLMGRSFDLFAGDRDAFIAAGGHDTVCPAVCGKAAVWTIEILADEGLI